ncbi:MAG: hypothetical protein PHU33_16460 [Bacteroidales bacterium]|nr:hypothetical protein [Bacteroidales bacterium]
MRKITALTNQTLYDIALEHIGTIEGVTMLIELNPGKRLDTPLVTGETIFIPDEATVPAVVSYYLKNNIHPISSLADQSPEAVLPIIETGTWLTIEGDIIVSLLHTSLQFVWNEDRDRYEAEISTEGSAAQLIADALFLIQTVAELSCEVLVNSAWNEVAVETVNGAMSFTASNVEAICLFAAADPGQVTMTIKIQ